ncbi:hypothetical protein LLG90_14470 [Aromatoleum toluclasticum]|nr:hypothetical protein [Aromatoleum toluclasticum]
MARLLMQFSMAIRIFLFDMRIDLRKSLLIKRESPGACAHPSRSELLVAVLFGIWWRQVWKCAAPQHFLISTSLVVLTTSDQLSKMRTPG